MPVREGVGEPTDHFVYSSPEIAGLEDDAVIIVAALPENNELPPAMRQVVVSIRRPGFKPAEIKLGQTEARMLADALREGFWVAPV